MYYLLLTTEFALRDSLAKNLPNVHVQMLSRTEIRTDTKQTTLSKSHKCTKSYDRERFERT